MGYENSPVQVARFETISRLSSRQSLMTGSHVDLNEYVRRCRFENSPPLIARDETNSQLRYRPSVTDVRRSQYENSPVQIARYETWTSRLRSKQSVMDESPGSLN